LIAYVAPDRTHPGYAETSLYIGLALLGRGGDRPVTSAVRDATALPARV
jgi:hypothetical protein